MRKGLSERILHHFSKSQEELQNLRCDEFNMLVIVVGIPDGIWKRPWCWN